MKKIIMKWGRAHESLIIGIWEREIKLMGILNLIFHSSNLNLSYVIGECWSAMLNYCREVQRTESALYDQCGNESHDSIKDEEAS